MNKNLKIFLIISCISSLLFYPNNTSLANNNQQIETMTTTSSDNNQIKDTKENKKSKFSFFGKKLNVREDNKYDYTNPFPDYNETETEKDLNTTQIVPETKDSNIKANTTITDIAAAEEEPEKTDPGVDIDMVSDYLDYYPEEEKMVAKGNASVKIRGQNTTLKADLITFYKATQIIVAEKNVRIIKNQMEMKGDYIKVDLSEESALIDRPVTNIAALKIDAKDAIVHTDKIDAFKGIATTNEKLNLVLVANSFNQFGDAKQEMINDVMSEDNVDKKTNYKIKTKQIIIKPDEYKNKITMKNADVYIGKRKIATIPSVDITTDKEISEIETMLPEIGQNRQTGMYIGPSGLISLPFGSTLKVSPVLAFNTSDIGAGGLIRYKSETNKTLLGYTSVKDLFIVEGQQDLFTPDLKLQYTANTYANDWFMGDRLPKYSAEAIYQKSMILDDLDLRFTQRYAAGYVADATRGIENDNSWGTFRVKAQGEVLKNRPIYNWKDMLWFNYRAQYDISQYATGETYAIIRTGPDMRFRYKRFKMSLMYLLSGIGGETPMWFDQYYYGRNNLSGMLEYKVNKYLSVGYYASANLSKDNWDKRLMAENRIYAKFGPPDFKISFGYDTVRSRTLMDVSMLVGSENSKIEFDKLTVLDPKKLEKPKEKPKFWDRWKKDNKDSQTKKETTENNNL